MIFVTTISFMPKTVTSETKTYDGYIDNVTINKTMNNIKITVLTDKFKVTNVYSNTLDSYSLAKKLMGDKVTIQTTYYYSSLFFIPYGCGYRVEIKDWGNEDIPYSQIGICKSVGWFLMETE